MSCKYSVGLKQALNFSKQQCVPLFFSAFLSQQQMKELTYKVKVVRNQTHKELSCSFLYHQTHFLDRYFKITVTNVSFAFTVLYY